MLRDVPKGPWQELGLDLFYFKGHKYLLIIDYFTKYVEVAKLQSSNTQALITIMKSVFARYGIPKIIYSDNGPQFQSTEMERFSKHWNFKHITSSPYYPQSNGMVERHIQSIKNMFKKVEIDGRDPNLALLEYRNTPINQNIKSPNELMFGRKINGIMPIEQTRSIKNDYKQVKEALKTRQYAPKYYYDSNVHHQPSIKLYEKVHVRLMPNTPLEPATIIGKCDRPRSYQVKLENGKILERTKRHILTKVANMADGGG